MAGMTVLTILISAGCSSSEKSDTSAAENTVQNTSAALSVSEKTVSETEPSAALAEEESFSYIAPDGETLTFDDIYVYVFDCAYISYEDAGSSIEEIRAGGPVKVEPGEILDNGLTVENPLTEVMKTEYGHELLRTAATFHGEITLTGTLECLREQQPMADAGTVYFLPDSNNNVKLPAQIDGIHRYYICNIYADENPNEKLIEILGDKETVSGVTATFSHISVTTSYSSSGVENKGILIDIA